MARNVDNDDNLCSISTLENEIDELFNSNELLKEPFCVVYSSFCEIMALDDYNYKAGCFIYIAEKLTDFTPMTVDECWDRVTDITHQCFATAHQCATLNQVFPLVHNKIYRLETHNGKNTLEYNTPHVAEIELRDEVITRLSTPIIGLKKTPELEFYNNIIRRLERNERLDILSGVNDIKNIYKLIPNEFYGDELISSAAYQQLGFSSKESFYNIRNAFFAVSEALIIARRIVVQFLKSRNIDEGSEEAENLLKSLSMIVIDENKLKTTISSIAGTNTADYENFCNFFFHNPKTDLIQTKKGLPVFWKLQTKIYFSPLFILRLLTTRNLLMIARNDNKLKKVYDYDGKVSCHLEPNLLCRVTDILNKKFKIYQEKKFDLSEVDLLIYCSKSNSILIVQAKATLPPEGFREVNRLDARIKEAKNQLDIFNRLTECQKLKVASECFPDTPIDNKTKFISGILVNSSFGSHASWDLMESNNILPLNCQLLNSTIKNAKDLMELKTCIWKYIDETVKSCQPKLVNKEFTHPNLNITQEKWEFDIRNVINKLALRPH